MNCVQCGAPTSIGTGYALPFLLRGANVPQQLYACSRQCRDEWNEARKQVKAIQAGLTGTAQNQTQEVKA